VAIAGSHGKTSTTSLIAAIMEHAGMDPTVVIGGKVNSLGSNARLGQGEYLVAEADESDGSFLKLSPTIAAVTNIDPEHLDYYGSIDRLKQTFLDFVNKIPFYGLAVVCLDCPNIQGLLAGVEKRHVTYGTTPQADYSVRGIKANGFSTTFVPIRGTTPLEPVTLQMVGRHYVLNALAAIAIADELEIPYAVTQKALSLFTGVQRRFTIRGNVNDVLVVDDYGHHPTEIKVTLAGARESFNRRIIAVFQPHRFSRTQLLFEQFATAFYDADLVLMSEIYAAGEEPLAGITGQSLAAAIRGHGHKQVGYFPDKAQIGQRLREIVQPGDVVLTLGAGDIWRVGQDLVDWLTQGRPS
jgi:UDP-N-acetylmuramate--alanine ligase